MITKTAKYIIAKQQDKDQALRTALGVAPLSLYAGGLQAHKAFASGDLTGRETLYHGSSKDAIRNIRKSGIKPTTDTNALNTAELRTDPERYNKSLGKAYATRNRLTAAIYAKQTEDILRKGYRNKYYNIMDILPHYNSNNIAKINAPVWKMKTVVNPEADMPYNEFRAKFIRPQDKYLRSMYNELRNNTVAFDGGLDAKYIKGNKGYVRNGLREILDYIKHNPSRFAKGLGRAGAGTALMSLPLATYTAVQNSLANQSTR